MYTNAARLTVRDDLHRLGGVASRAELAALGIGPAHVTAQLAARRWRAHGSAILLHNGEPGREQRWRMALINCGLRAVLTSFTSAEQWGLRGWERDEIHVLAPGGTTNPQLPGVRLHRTRDWSAVPVHPLRRAHRLAPALVLAASSFEQARPACGILAAAVQQRLLRPPDLRAALDAARRTRHRAALLRAVDDISQGAHALSEIDFGRLCRRHGLPAPRRQAIRASPGGRRRYLDAEWCLPDGRIVAAEVDGGLHLIVTTWWADQLRQNDLVVDGALLLRFPSVVIRHEEPSAVDQLRRALRA